MSDNPYIGSSLGDVLVEEGILDEATEHAVERRWPGRSARR